MSIEWANAVAGLGVGILVGLTGVGGGSLMTPILVMLFGFVPSVAVGTDLWFSAITKMVGGYVHGKRGTIDWQVLRRLFYGSLPASLATLVWLHMSGAGKNQSHLITSTLGAVLILTSATSMLRTRFQAFGERMRAGRPIEFKSLQPVLTVVAGAILGFLVTFTSIGAGALGAVMLLYLYPRRMTPTVLVGTDIVHAIPLTLLAGTGHLLMGNVDLKLLASLLIGSIPGILIGSLANARAPEKFLRGAIAVMLALVGAKMVFY